MILHWRHAFFWLFVAVIVDAVDGTLARWVGVKQALPHFDGTLLDNVVDYVSYVIVPAFFLMRLGIVPPGLSLVIAGGICLASAYQFCQVDAKTPDHTFKGFPSYWNIALLYLFVLQLDPVWNAGILLLLIVLVFVPIKYLYPTRAVRFRRLTLWLTCLWGIAVAVIVWQLPSPNLQMVYASMSYFIYYVGMSLFLMFRNPQQTV